MDLLLEDDVFYPNMDFTMEEELKHGDGMIDEARLHLGNLSFDESRSKNKSNKTKNLLTQVLPKFGPESQISAAMENLVLDKKTFKKCKSCGKLKNMLEFRNHERNCTRSMYKCLSCKKPFHESVLEVHEKRCSLLHEKTGRKKNVLNCRLPVLPVKMSPTCVDIIVDLKSRTKLQESHKTSHKIIRNIGSRGL